MKKQLLLSLLIACCSASAQKIYVEDMQVVRNLLPTLPSTIEAVKKACTTANCTNIKDRVAISLKLRMDSMSMPQAMVMEEPGNGPMELLTPGLPDKVKEKGEAVTKSIDSMETLLQKEKILTIKNGKSDYHETPAYGKALKELSSRLKTPVISNAYYHMNYQERETYRDSLYTLLGIDRVKTNHLLAYEKLIFEKNRKNIFEVISIASEQQRKFKEIKNKCTTEIKTHKDSTHKKFNDITLWKQKELAKAKTPAEKTSINQQAATKNQKLLSTTHSLLIVRYDILTRLYDEQLIVLNETLKNYEFGNNATINQEKQMQNMVAQSQLTGYLTMGTLTDFCAFAHETIIKYSSK